MGRLICSRLPVRGPPFQPWASPHAGPSPEGRRAWLHSRSQRALGRQAHPHPHARAHCGAARGLTSVQLPSTRPSVPCYHIAFRSSGVRGPIRRGQRDDFCYLLLDPCVWSWPLSLLRPKAVISGKFTVPRCLSVGSPLRAKQPPFPAPPRAHFSPSPHPAAPPRSCVRTPRASASCCCRVGPRPPAERRPPLHAVPGSVSSPRRSQTTGAFPGELTHII